MLRMTQSKNSAAAKQYYTTGLATPDYYTEKGQELGHWGGVGAEMLGLSSGVDQKAFFRLADNQHPETGKKLTPRTKDVRRVGYDFTFNAPKSVSIAYSLGTQETKQIIRKAFEQAVSDTMTAMERDMQVRIRKGGAKHTEMTGNMIWASFVHDTSRPMDDGFVDPHLHSHNFVFNATHHAKEGWKAGEFAAVKRDAPYFESVFHNDFANKLQEAGLSISPTKHRWEIDGINREVIDRFSRRTEQIETLATEQDITDAAEKSNLAARNRNNKRQQNDWQSIKQNWQERYSQDNQPPVESLFHSGQSHHVTTEQAVDYALGHHLERQSVARERDVLRTALQFGVGSLNLTELQEQLEAKTLRSTLSGEPLITTPEIHKEEVEMLNFVREGRGTQWPLASGEVTIESDFLNDGQRDTIKGVLSSPDRVMAVIGRAGVGKTTVMKEIAANMRREGKQLLAFAPSADASRNVLRKEGFASADTIAKLLIDSDLQEAIKNQVILIDEAGMVGTKTLNEVFALAEDRNARVILSGDPKQHSGVERGDALRLLEKNAGLHTHYMERVVRQKRRIFRRAVEAISNGNLETSLDKLSEMGAFQELSNTKNRHQQIAEDYTQAITRDQSVLVVSPTHREGAKISAAIRQHLRESGTIAKDDHTKAVLQSLSFTEAQKTNITSYESGQVIQLNQNMKGFMRGEQLQVVGQHDQHHLRVTRASGEAVTLPLVSSNRFEVYRTKEIPFAKGDKIRITQNGFTKETDHTVTKKRRLNNGAEYTIKRLTKDGDIVLNNDWMLDKGFAHLKHGYVSTSHASQGKTVDKVLIAQSTESFGKASTMEQFYVSVSRGKQDVTIYTNDIHGLKSELTKSQKRMAATELLPNGVAKKDWFFGPMKRAVDHFRRTFQNPSKPPVSVQHAMQPTRR